MYQPRLIVDRLGFAEGLRWHAGRLWASDIALRQVIAIDVASQPAKLEVALKLDDQPSGLGWMPDGSMLVIAMRTRKLLRVRNSAVSVHADLSPLVKADLNDMVVDAAGRAYVTNFGYDAEKGDAEAATGILIVEPDGSATMTPAELMRPNGCAITADGRTFVVAETRVHRLSAYARAGDGTLSKHRAFGTAPEKTWADGICLDAEGAAWIGDPIGRQMLRMRDGGEIAERISCAPLQPVACALGGPQRRTLFFASSRLTPDWDAAARDRHGRIEAIEVPVPGAGWPQDP
jgi:sugar lactone lactonase YvrE